MFTKRHEKNVHVSTICNNKTGINSHVHHRIYKLCYICIMSDYPAKGMNDSYLHVATWIHFTNVILSKRKQNHKVNSV